MSLVVPNAIALANIADGSAIVASDHRNNYSAVQVGVNGLIAMFNLATAKGDLLVATAAGTFDRLPVGANGLAVVADSTQPLGVKYAAAGPVTYRKTTVKTVNTTVAATDLLNGEITVAANAMGASGLLRLTAWGDWLQNSGGSVAPPRFQVKLGATTILDTNAGGIIGTGAGRYDWRMSVEILNLGATNSQREAIWVAFSPTGSVSVGNTAFTTGAGFVVETGASELKMAGNNTSAVDTTAANALVVNVINASASATYETKLFGALIEIV